MDKPRIAVADLAVPNAFATGRSPGRAVLCVTTGLLGRLDDEQLEGVLAHELSHVAHRDVAVMTAASFLGVLAGLLVRFGAFTGLSRGRRDDGGVLLLVVAGAAIVYVAGMLLTLALSRYRELAADRAGALLTGRPSALASALVTLSEAADRIPTQDLRTVEPFNALMVVPARGGALSRLFSTHPPLKERLDRLAALSTAH
jgi:heat shock protein HtpX